MSDAPEQPSDEELSELIDDEEKSVDSGSGEPEGAVEVGIPPAVEDEGEVDSSEEMFSMDDFDSAEEVFDNPIEETIVSNDAVSEKPDSEEVSLDTQDPEEVVSEEKTVEEVVETNGSGGVAEFRKTLSNLSRQLEIDRLAFLHQAMKERGEKVPTLSQIAADIKGTKLLAAKGDCDQYCSRPTARLEGWVSGLSFGANRRAKKFNK